MKFSKNCILLPRGPVYRGLLLTFIAFVPLRGYLAESANKSGHRAGQCNHDTLSLILSFFLKYF